VLQVRHHVIACGSRIHRFQEWRSTVIESVTSTDPVTRCPILRMPVPVPVPRLCVFLFHFVSYLGILNPPPRPHCALFCSACIGLSRCSWWFFASSVAWVIAMITLVSILRKYSHTSKISRRSLVLIEIITLSPSSFPHLRPSPCYLGIL